MFLSDLHVSADLVPANGEHVLSAVPFIIFPVPSCRHTETIVYVEYISPPEEGPGLVAAEPQGSCLVKRAFTLGQVLPGSRSPTFNEPADHFFNWEVVIVTRS